MRAAPSHGRRDGAIEIVGEERLLMAPVHISQPNRGRQGYGVIMGARAINWPLRPEGHFSSDTRTRVRAPPPGQLAMRSVGRSVDLLCAGRPAGCLGLNRRLVCTGYIRM